MDETWKCPNCGFIAGTHVKFDETCEHCGSGVTASEAVEGLEAANLRLTAQVEKYEEVLNHLLDSVEKDGDSTERMVHNVCTTALKEG